MNLCTFAVILVFTRETLVLESVKDFANSLGGLGEHRFEGYTRCKFACRTEIVDTTSEEGRDYKIITRKFTDGW